jgi:hypothetical protein
MTSGNETARDVLAAEAFAVPAPDPALRHEPIDLPQDPTGIAEPHDVLAAEEFALPAAEHHAGHGASGRSTRFAWRVGIGAAAVALLAAGLRRRSRL